MIIMIIGFGNERSSGDNPNYSIVEIGQNTEKSPGNLRRLFASQTPVKDHRLTLMGKTLNNNNNNNNNNRIKAKLLLRKQQHQTWY